MAKVDDADALARVELLLQIFGLEARCYEAFQHHVAANQAANEECYDAKNQQSAREAADPVENVGIALEQIAKESATGEQHTHPQRCSDAVIEQELAKPHAVLPSDGRRQRRQARDELGKHEHCAAAAAKGILRAANACGRLQRKFAEQAQHTMALCAPEEEPDAIGGKRRGHCYCKGEGKTDLLLG